MDNSQNNLQDNPQEAPPAPPVEEPHVLQERELLTAADVLRTEGRQKGRPSTLEKLPANIYREYLENIRRGCFNHIAAQVLGIMPTTLSAWMKRGRKAKSGIYRLFYIDTMEARGAARQLAENRVYVENPITWLKAGPGRADWAEQNVLNVQGRVAHEHEHEHQYGGEVELTIKQQRQRKCDTIAAALGVLEELGLIQRTKQGEALFLTDSSSDEDGGDGEGILDVPSTDGEE